MLLHFLGLDHIGHVLGAHNSEIDEKLQKYDKIIEHLYNKLATSKSIIFITGDHGMRDAGGHGGSTAAETLVPLIVLGHTCNKNSKDTYDQVDLATTISLLLNIEVPETSIGMLIPELVIDLYDEDGVLNAFNYTSNRLLQKNIGQIGETTVKNSGNYFRYSNFLFGFNYYF